MGRKKVNQLMQSDNGLIAELADVKWIKQPVIYSMISGDFTLMQMNIIIALSKAIQERIEEYLSRNCKSQGGGKQLTLFSNDEMAREAITIHLDLSDLGIRSDMYDKLESACENLMKMSMSYPVYENKKLANRVYINLFSRIVIPTNSDDVNGNPYAYKGGKRRKGIISVTMLTKNLSDVFDMSHGYVNHIATIAQFCKKKRTPRVYIYLERWRNYKTKTVDYIEFKEYLGLLRYDRKNNVVKDEIYPSYWEFCQKVLNPVKKEMDKLLEKNLIDISFDYEPIYRTTRKRGTPDEIKFTIKMSEMGKQLLEKGQVQKDVNSVLDHLKKEYGYTDNDLKFMTDSWVDEMLPALEQEILTLKEKEAKYKPQNPKGYVLVCLKNFVKAHQPVCEEVKEEEPKQEEPQDNSVDKLSRIASELAKFEKVLDAIRQRDALAYRQFFSFIKLIDVENNLLVFAVPTKFIYEQIEGTYLELFREALYEQFPDADVKYNINETYFK